MVVRPWSNLKPLLRTYSRRDALRLLPWSPHPGRPPATCALTSTPLASHLVTARIAAAQGAGGLARPCAMLRWTVERWQTCMEQGLQATANRATRVARHSRLNSTKTFAESLAGQHRPLNRRCSDPHPACGPRSARSCTPPEHHTPLPLARLEQEGRGGRVRVSRRVTVAAADLVGCGSLQLGGRNMVEGLALWMAWMAPGGGAPSARRSPRSSPSGGSSLGVCLRLQDA